MIIKSSVAVVFGVTALLFADSAYAAGLSDLVTRINSFNSELKTVGGAMAVGGLIWALLGVTVGISGTSKAVVVLACGFCISVAPQVMEMVTGINP